MNNNIPITEEEIQEIDRYLSGELSAAEKQAFERRLETDNEWAAKCNEIRLLSVGVQETALRNQLDSFHENATSRQKPATVRSLGLVKKLAAAAVFIVLLSTIGWYFLYSRSSEEKLFAAYYQPDPGLATVMSVTDNYEFERAMVDYKTGAYTQALERWNKLYENNNTSDTLQYFIASAQLANKDPKAAIQLFDKIISGNNSVFINEAYWYKGLALLQLGKRQEAAIAIEKSNHVQKAALLNKIRD